MNCRQCLRSGFGGDGNGYVFGETGKCRDRVKFVIDLAKEIHRSTELNRPGNEMGVRVEKMIAWRPPEGEWGKLNTDGASRGNPGLAAADGVLRYYTGRWCGGFAFNIGVRL